MRELIEKLNLKSSNRILKTVIELPLRYEIKKKISLVNEIDINMVSAIDRDKILSYIKSLEIDKYQYKFSLSTTKPTLYSSIYALMIKGLLGDLTENDLEWCDYFDDYQRDNGLFYDPVIYNENFDEGDGWGARHLAGHLIIGYKRFNRIPKKDFAFLKKYEEPENIIKMLETLDYKKVWAASNKIMNIGVLMQYSRDYMSYDSLSSSIDAMLEWLINTNSSENGLWYEGNIQNIGQLYEACRGAYHIYPMFIYDNITLPNIEKAIDSFLGTQNKWGGFNEDIKSSACDDIDIIDPLMRLSRFSDYRNNDIKKTLEKAYKWILVNQNSDGGFVFKRHSKFAYGGHNELSSIKEESNIFATWFRTLSILYLDQYLFDRKVDMVNIPGYEMKL